MNMKEEVTEEIIEHIEELNDSIDVLERRANRKDYVTWDSYNQLMQAKSTALLALATIATKEVSTINYGLVLSQEQ
ncbi:hypothetical protein ABE137_12065 [Brevibacillus laterosporus]|uniref:hypothetical protein n=1 Tax=Brevibacillus phage Sundance TaxID=1691958 RepID=UPI0006BC3F60|nr:hypothetical protein AVT09_gp082 [Brevibacillus phage Sundance]ALA47898.1 hypothetical protein SUNDANCE_82 [Brevibacillus phage Sundance]